VPRPLLLVDSSVWVDCFRVRVLRAKGITIRETIDTLIATRYIEDLTLLHADRDFLPFVDGSARGSF
jgi:hypothetical protein